MKHTTIEGLIKEQQGKYYLYGFRKIELSLSGQYLERVVEWNKAGKRWEIKGMEMNGKLYVEGLTGVPPRHKKNIINHIPLSI